MTLKILIPLDGDHFLAENPYRFMVIIPLHGIPLHGEALYDIIRHPSLLFSGKLLKILKIIVRLLRRPRVSQSERGIKPE